MGVDRTQILMYAYDVGHDKFDFDEHENEVNGVPEARFDAVVDGMCGKYFYVGKILAHGDEFEEPVVITAEELIVDRGALVKLLSDTFLTLIEPSDLKLILFTHFS